MQQMVDCLSEMLQERVGVESLRVSAFDLFHAAHVWPAVLSVGAQQCSCPTCMRKSTYRKESILTWNVDVKLQAFMWLLDGMGQR